MSLTSSKEKGESGPRSAGLTRMIVFLAFLRLDLTVLIVTLLRP